MKSKTPPIPAERPATLRQLLIARLSGPAATARQLSSDLGISEREVYSHLAHIRRSLQRQHLKLEVTPACCHACDFSFDQRDRLERPGRCPRCRGTSLSEPRFGLGRP